MSKGRWLIAVCRTCHRPAHWPFCEHRDEDNTDWYAWVQMSGKLPDPPTVESEKAAT